MNENPNLIETNSIKKSPFTRIINKYSVLVITVLVLNTSCAQKETNIENILSPENNWVSSETDNKDFELDYICFSSDPVNEPLDREYNSECTVSQYFSEIWDTFKKGFLDIKRRLEKYY